jgi:hypothetical protein
MKTNLVRKGDDEWAVYDTAANYLGSVLRFSLTQFSAYPGGARPSRGSPLDRWYPTRQQAAKALAQQEIKP